MNTSMSNEFYDWLNDCPVQWCRLDHDGDGTADYSFTEPDKEEAPDGATA